MGESPLDEGDEDDEEARVAPRATILEPRGAIAGQFRTRRAPSPGWQANCSLDPGPRTAEHAASGPDAVNPCATHPTHRPEPRPGPLGLVLLLLALASCRSYPQRTREAFAAFQRGHLAASAEAYAELAGDGDDFLAGAESGMVLWTAGDWDGALRQLHAAGEASADIEGRALVGPERLGEGVASWALNDTARAYEGEGFERVYLHALLAMTYLAMGLLEDVGVEVRLADALLTAEEELYEKEYRAGGLGHLVSAVSYELRGQPDQAYIDYERMHEKGVGTALAGRALVRLARTLDRTDALARWEELYGADVERPAGAASVVVLAGVGVGPYKIETSIPVPTHDGVIPFAAAGYRVRPQAVPALRLIEVETDTSVRTDVVESVSEVAAENLEDRQLYAALKSIARGVLKRELTKHLEKEWGDGGRILGDVFALVTERADLRAWQTLPDTWQACRLFLPPGVHVLDLEAVGGARSRLGTFELDPGETMVVFARTVGPALYAHPVGGRLIETTSAPAPEVAAPMQLGQPGQPE